MPIVPPWPFATGTQTEHAVYWDNSAEFKDIPSQLSRGTWWGTLIELDSIHMLHFHTYLFQIDDYSQLRIFAHHSFDIPLLEFLDCR